MAIAIAEAVAEIVSTTNASTYDFGSFTPAANRILVILALCRGTVATGSITNVSGTSLTWTKKGSGTFNSGADTVYCFWAKTPASTAASVYRVSLTGDAATGCIAYMFSVTEGDMLTADPIKQLKTNSAASTNPTSGTLVSAMDANNGYVAAWMGALSSSNPANVSAPPTSWTEIGDNGFGTPTSNASAAYRATGETASSISFTAATTTWGLIFAEIYTANSGPGPLLTDSLNNWSDTSTRDLCYCLSFLDVLALSDAQTLCLTSLLSFPDTLTLTDAVFVDLQGNFPLSQEVSDALTLTDVSFLLLHANQSFSDSLNNYLESVSLDLVAAGGSGSRYYGSKIGIKRGIGIA